MGLLRVTAAIASFWIAILAHAAPDYVPDESALQRMNLGEAHRVLVGWSGLKFTSCNGCNSFNVSNVEVTEEGVLRITHPHTTTPSTVKLWALKIEVEKFAFGTESSVHLAESFRLWTGRNFDGAKSIADALYVIKRYAEGYEDPRVEAAFQAALQARRTNSPPAEFPEEARRFRVIAEAAVKGKNLLGASENYEKALGIAPWWPAGRFNRAFILGEMKQYGAAVREMKRYLLLMPEAPNARDAQDKIYEWEDKATRK